MTSNSGAVGDTAVAVSALRSAALVSSALAGDDDALASLMRAHHGRLLRFGQRVCASDADAHDAVQEAFIGLARRPALRSDPGVLSWMFTVVKNWCLRLVRRARARLQRETLTFEFAPAPLTPEAALEQYRLAELVRDALATLAPPYKEVIVLKDLEGLPGEQVSDALGLSRAALKSRLHRARAALRQALAERLAAAEG